MTLSQMTEQEQLAYDIQQLQTYYSYVAKFALSMNANAEKAMQITTALRKTNEGIKELSQLMEDK